MSKKSKKDKELDIILEQLKKSYGTESSDVTEDLPYESADVEEDTELSAVLSKLFSEEQETIESESEDYSEDDYIEPEDATIESEDFEEAEVIELETSNEGEIEDEIIESEIFKKDEAEEGFTELDPSKEDEVGVKFIESESFDENEIEEEFIESKSFDEDEIEEEFIESESFDEDEIEEEFIESESFDEDEIEEEFIESESFDKDEIEIEEDLDEANELENISIDTDYVDELESTSVEPEFAVEDEEYDILPYSVPEESELPQVPEDSVYSTTEVETDELVEEPSEEPSEQVREESYEKAPILILDPAQYTPDPLQDGLPKFKSIITKTKQSISTSDVTEEIEANETEDFDNNDISLLLKLGYDDEIKSKVGEEKTQNVIFESNRNFVPEDNQNTYGFCGEELTDRNQIPKIKQRYQSNKRSLLITLASVFILFLMILSVTIYFDTYSSRTDTFPILLTIEFVLVAIIAAILYKKLYVGIVGMIKLVSDHYSVLSLVLAVYALYDVSALISYAINRKTMQPSDLALFGTCAALYALVTVVADFVNCIKEASAFDLIASSNKLFTAEKAAADDINPAHSEEITYKIRRTSLISGYFKKTSQSRLPLANLIYVLGVVPLIALIIGCTFAISSGSVMTGISSATVSVMLCIPLSYVCIFSFNEYVISTKLGADRIAFIGYDAATEYSKVQNLTFKDRDVIFITSYSEIHPQTAHGQNSLDIAYEVFNTLGGTLAEYRSSAESRQHSAQNPNIVINSISDNGIDISYALSTNILLGDKNYMRAHNIKVKTDSSLYGATKGSDRSVLYMAFDGIPKLGFILGSRIAPGFIKASHELEACGVKVFVDSYEPHVNDLYFEQNTEERLAVEVLKPQTRDPYICKDIRDGKVVCASDGFNLAKLVPISKRIVRQRKICKYINYGLMSAGFILSCLLAFAISSKSDSALFGFIENHCSLITSLILLMGLIPGLIALLNFKKDKTKTIPTTIQNGDTKQK